MIAPIARIVVAEDDSLKTILYTPGLPPGSHDVYCDPWEGWQPIETCPPNTRVLLWHPDLGYAVTGWPEAYGYKTGGWKATFWMPLPAPPPVLCPHGMPLAENICGPCSKGEPNRSGPNSSGQS